MLKFPNILTLFGVLIVLLGTGGCYTFKGISIDPRVNTFFVANFDNAAPNAPPTLALDFTERLKDKIRAETRLTLKTDESHVEFQGQMTDYRVEPIAPQPGQEIVALNRLVIKVRVKAVSNMDEEVKWPQEREFQHFAEFSNDADLTQIQNTLIRQIGDQLLEDVFNYFFNNW